MAKNKNEIVRNETILLQPLEEVLHNSMMPYAEHVILERALPRVEDGLKPVQRRILYAMSDLGILPDKPHKKSARIVGECLGKYHPHGDTSVYDAMVRMAQDFNMRATLVDGHGNFGSIDGDPAAAMRYTEARLTPLALELLSDLEKDTVSWSLNFDDTLQEPDMLPGRFPNLLVNGASGIAVGLATNIPSHNLAEVIDATIAQIDNPRITLPDLMHHLKGPDFPTGGQIINGDELENIYKNGRGRVLLRANTTIENMPNGKKAIVLTELPYQVNKAKLLADILKVREEKKGILAGISDIRDESDRTGMRAVIELKKDVDADKVLQFLYKHTDLQTSFGANMVAIADGKPQQLGLKEILRYYIEHQKTVERRRVRYDLDQARERAHILEGLVIAVKNIDRVIKIIRSSKHTTEARANLRAAFELSEKQAQAILDMRLARLTALEIENLENELRQVRELIAELESILASERKLLGVIKDNLLTIKRKYKDARRTQIIASTAEEVVDESAFTVVEDIVIAIDADNGIKRINEKNFCRSNWEEIPQNVRSEEICKYLIKARTDDKLVLFTDTGNYYTVPCADIPELRWKDKAAQLARIGGLAIEERTIAVFLASQLSGTLNFYTSGGMIKRTAAEEYSTARKGKIQAISLKDNDAVIAVEIDAGGGNILCISRNGYSLNFSKEEVTLTGRTTQGVKGMALDDDDAVVYASQVTDEGEILIITDRGYMKRTLLVDYEPMQRNRKGLKTIEFKKNGANGNLITAAFYVTEPFDVLVVQKSGDTSVVNTEGVFIENRVAPGRSYVLSVMDNTVDLAMRKVGYTKE